VIFNLIFDFEKLHKVFLCSFFIFGNRIARFSDYDKVFDKALMDDVETNYDDDGDRSAAGAALSKTLSVFTWFLERWQ
jgi:hypothetical protein